MPALLVSAISLVLAVFAAYSFFCAGANYMSAYTTGVLIPFRKDALVTGVLGTLSLAILLCLNYYF